jgi:hypothetical protein
MAGHFYTTFIQQSVAKVANFAKYATVILLKKNLYITVGSVIARICPVFSLLYMLIADGFKFTFFISADSLTFNLSFGIIFFSAKI